MDITEGQIIFLILVGLAVHVYSACMFAHNKPAHLSGCLWNVFAAFLITIGAVMVALAIMWLFSNAGAAIALLIYLVLVPAVVSGVKSRDKKMPA